MASQQACPSEKLDWIYSARTLSRQYFPVDLLGLDCLTTSTRKMAFAFSYQTASRATAMPCPTPMHMVASARLLALSFSSSAAVPVMRAPDMPSG